MKSRAANGILPGRIERARETKGGDKLRETVRNRAGS
jgi:hypothetical protein